MPLHFFLKTTSILQVASSNSHQQSALHGPTNLTEFHRHLLKNMLSTEGRVGTGYTGRKLVNIVCIVLLSEYDEHL